jgi:phosphatidate cytidylyltransferase
MLKHRVRSGILMGAALLAALFFLPPAGALAVVVVCCALATWEFYSLLNVGGVPHSRWIGVGGSVALLLVTWWGHKESTPSYLIGDAEGLVLFVVLALTLLRQMSRPVAPSALTAVAATLLGVLYVGLLFNFLNKLLIAFGVEEGRLLIFYLVLVVKSTDIGAYFTGCRFGGPKFCPRISPAKTWSGVAGGMMAGLLCSLIGGFFLHPHLSDLNFGVSDAFILGLLLPAAGIAGDLIESLLKRASGVKDSGTIIQGMGGILDVVDSLLFTAPILYLYLRQCVDTVP